MIPRLDEVFRTRKSPYYIVTNAYRETSSGLRATHYLCHVLNGCGYEAHLIFADGTPAVSPELWTPVWTETVLRCHYVSGRKPIVIYPESVGEFALGYGLTVRYLFNKPGFIEGPDRRLGPADLLVAFRQEFAGDQPVRHLLTVPPCDPSIFHPSGLPDQERSGRYFYFNRFLRRGGSLSPETAGAIEISPRALRSLQELAEIFKRAELLYCYEWGAVAAEARMCGCPVVCIPNETMLPYFDDHTFGMDGVGWGTSEDAIAKAKSTVHLFYPRYLSMFESFRVQLSLFIEVTQKAAREMSFDSCFPRSFLESAGWLQPEPGELDPDSEESSNRQASQVPITVARLAKLLWEGLRGR